MLSVSSKIVEITIHIKVEIPTDMPNEQIDVNHEIDIVRRFDEETLESFEHCLLLETFKFDVK